MKCFVSKSKGRYGWRLDGREADEEVCVSVSYGDEDTPTVCLSERWPLDEEPIIEDVPPSEVVDMIEERLKSYWINTAREGKLAQIAKFRERAVEYDRAWANYMIGQVNDEITSQMRRRSYFEDLLTPAEA